MPQSSIPAVIDQARKNLSSELWDHVAGGSGTEATVQRNRQAFEQLLFRPRVLVDVSDRHTDGSFLGHRLSSPVMLAPIRSLGLLHEEGTLAAARAAAEAGTIPFISAMSERSLEDVADAVDGPKVVQISPFGGMDVMSDAARRAEDTGYVGICVTLTDVVVPPNERNVRNKFVPASPPQRDQGQPVDRDFPAKVTWEDLSRLREASQLPLILKGIMTPEDARLAVEYGADSVYVSNHGGLRLDFAPAAVELLPDIVGAVAGRVPVILDGGVMRGSDVVKAIALGATAVLIGRLQCWGVAAGGTLALMDTLRLLEEEVSSVMALLGVTALEGLKPKHLLESHHTLQSLG